MKTITLELSETEFARLSQAVDCRYEPLAKHLKAWLIDLIADPIDPFAPRRLGRGVWDVEFLRRIA